jgi:hypothetical protein
VDCAGCEKVELTCIRASRSSILCSISASLSVASSSVMLEDCDQRGSHLRVPRSSEWYCSPDPSQHCEGR